MSGRRASLFIRHRWRIGLILLITLGTGVMIGISLHGVQSRFSANAPGTPRASSPTTPTTATVPPAITATAPPSPSPQPATMTGTPTGTPTAAATGTPTGTPTAAASSTAVVTATPTVLIVAPTATLLPTAVSPKIKVTEAARPIVLPGVIGSPASLLPQYRRYHVGAYYFSGWSHGQNDNLNPMLMNTFAASEPLIGWYDDTQAHVDQSIDLAANAGINFFAFDWFDTARSPYATDQTLNEGLTYYLSSSQRYRMGFCIMFTDHQPFLPRPSDWPGVVDSWITLFKQPDYVHVNGKPLLVIFSPEYMRTIFGSSANVRAALDYVRQRAQQAGLPGVTIAVASTVTATANPIHIQELNAEGYDAATGYSYHGTGGEQYNKPAPYAKLIDENAAMWDRVAAQVHIPYIPVITSGFDLRYSIREKRTAIIYTGKTARAFSCYAVLARHWIDTHPTQTTKERVVLVYAWTEMGEGGAIIPSVGDGFSLAQALGSVFGTTDTAPTTPPYCL